MHHVKSLECFVAVAQNKSIRAAAEIVHLSSSALNRQILDLEDQVGAPLFERHARGVRLSPAGEAYLAYAKRALRDAESVHAHIDALRGLRRGQIRLHTVATIADERLMALIASFQQAHPQVGVTLNVGGSSDIVDAVLANDADLGVVFNLPTHGDFHELASKSYSLHAVVASGHPLAANASVSLVALRDYPIALGDRGWGGRMLLDEYLRRTRLALQPQFVSNSIDVLTRFVKATDGVCFQIRAGAQPAPVAGGLVAIPVTELKDVQRVMVLGCLKGRLLPPAAARFSEILRRDLFSD